MRDITLEDTFRHQFTTRQFSDGVPTQLAGSPVLSVLEENNATPITAGVSVSVDRASVTGLNEATVIATAANGYETLKSYSIYISTGTVGGVSVVGEVVGSFTIDKTAQAIWDTLLTGSTHNIATSAGKRLRQLQEAFVIAEGTAEAGTATTITLEAGAVETVDNIYRGDRVVITAGTGVAEHGIILSYTGSTRVCIMAETWVTTPSTDSVYEITPASVDVETIQHVIQTGGNLAEAVITNAAGTDVAADIIAIKAETALIVTDTNSLNDGAISELAQGVPSATPTLQNAVMLMYMALRNKLDVQTSGTDALEIHNNAGTQIAIKLLTDDGSDFSEAKMTTGV